MKKTISIFLLLFCASFGFAQLAKHNLKTTKVTSSEVRWWGYKVVKSEATTHSGTINVKNGKFIFDNGDLTGGSFILDMRSITDTDLTGADQIKLTNDLKSVNFFEVKKFPVATFEIKKILPLKSTEYNSTIIGDLIMKNIRKTVSFPANVIITGYDVDFQSAKFTLNRQDWRVFYKSSIKDYLIKDNIDVQIKLSAVSKLKK